MKNSVMAIGVMALSFVLGSCWGGRSKSSATSFRLVERVKDSTIYGICLEMKGKDTMLFMSDMGDSAWLVLGKTEICGHPSEEDQLALMMDGRHTVRKLINISTLMGTWVEPDPIQEGYDMGFSLLEGGYASSINSRVHNYTNWSFFNGKLLLTSQNDMGGGMGEYVVDTFDIVELYADSLIMKNLDYTFRYGHPSDSVSPTLNLHEIGDSTDYMQFIF